MLTRSCGQLQRYLLVHSYVHAEAQHALDPVPVRLGVGQLVARSQRRRLKQDHGQIFCRLVLCILLENETFAVRMQIKEHGSLFERGSGLR